MADGQTFSVINETRTYVVVGSLSDGLRPGCGHACVVVPTLESVVTWVTKALATCEVRGPAAKKHWKNDVKLMEFEG